MAHTPPARAGRSPSEGVVLLRKWRAGKGLTQAAAAAVIGLDPTTLNHVEHGRVVPGMRRAVRIAKATKGAVPITAWEASWRKVA